MIPEEGSYIMHSTSSEGLDSNFRARHMMSFRAHGKVVHYPIFGSSCCFM